MQRTTAWRTPLLLYAVSRVVSTALILVTIRFARPGSHAGLHAHLLDVLTAWDGQWYRLIALQGYPAHLPTTTAGITENAWAFLPVYPQLVRLLSFGVPAAWPLTAVLVSTASGAVATVLLAALVRPAVGDRGAAVTAALFVFSPVAFVLETAYADALALALLFGALLLIDRARSLAAVPVVVVLAFTRPGAQAVALFVVLRFIVRLRAEGGQRPGTWVAAATLAAVTAAAGWAWPEVATLVTGVPSAYLRTELTWRQSWTGSAVLAPFTSWLSGADFWLGSPVGPIVLAVLLGGWTALLLSRFGRSSGATVRLWAASWTLYLLAVVFPQSSVLRLLMPLAPAGSLLARVRTRPLVGVLLLCVAAQGAWVFCVYGLRTRFWTVP